LGGEVVWCGRHHRPPTRIVRATEASQQLAVQVSTWAAVGVGIRGVVVVVVVGWLVTQVWPAI